MEESNFAELKYTLTYEEMREALYAAGKLTSHRNKSMVQTVLAAIATLMFTFNILANPNIIFNYFVVVLCLALIPFVWIAPQMIEKRIINSVNDCKEQRLEVFEDFITVNKDCDNMRWEALPDDSVSVTETNNLYVISFADSRLLTIPKRAVDEKDAETVEKCIEQFK